MSPTHSNPTTVSPVTARRRPKVVVVGAGPAGSACALELRRRDAAEVVIVDRSRLHRRKVCGSGLSPLALDQLDALGMLPSLRPAHAEMRGLRAIGPGGDEIVLRGAKGAWVVPRAVLDAQLLQAAVAAGATFRERTRVRGILADPEGNARGVRFAGGEIEADCLVVATGSPSTLEVDEHPRQGIRTIMGWWHGRLDDDIGTMIWDRRLGGYYAWAFPEPNDVVNVGLTIPEDYPRSNHLRGLFDELLEDHFRSIVEGGERIGRWAGHPATVTTRIGTVAQPRTLYVGEAARLVCPATVEGISFALHSGRIAAETIDRAFDPRRGLGTLARWRYHASLSLHMLPTFLAGDALRRVLRSPSACARISALVDTQRLASGLARLVGEQPRQQAA